MNVTKESLGRRRGDKRQIMIERIFVHLGSHRRMLEDCFNLGSKDEAPLVMIEVKRLDAGPVARQHQPLAFGVPQRDAVIAFEIVNEIQAALFVEMQDGFRIGPRAVNVTTSLEAFA